MLWVWANYKNYTRYFYLNVEGGFLTLEAKGHKEPKTLQFKGKRVDDNEWHTVVLTKRSREASVQVSWYQRFFPGNKRRLEAQQSIFRWMILNRRQ